jgi:hypothetical protein
MQCRPHSNGNQKQDFKRAGMGIHKASNVFSDVLSEALSEVTNSRNYQHLSSSEALVARDADLLRIGTMLKCVQDAADVGIELFKSGE